LQDDLRDVVVPYGSKGEYFGARHPLIADWLINEGVSREDLRRAYVALLSVLAKEMPTQRRRSSPSFRLFWRLINHAELYGRFHKSIDNARAIYRAIEDAFSEDPHLWLQYGSLELEYGELELASLYLNQAQSLAPADNFINTALGHLDMRKAIEAPSR